MRYQTIKPLTEAELERLDELRMNPKSLKAFASSPEAEGIKAGFEAELVFRGLGLTGGESEADMDMDERCRSISQVIDFFENDDYGMGMSRGASNRLQTNLDEKYFEWYDEKMFEAWQDEMESEIREYMEEDRDVDEEIREELEAMGLSEDEVDDAMIQGSSAPRFSSSAEQFEAIKANKAYANYIEAKDKAEDKFDDKVREEIEDQGRIYDRALDNFRDNFNVDDDREFFSDIGLSYMSDVAEEFGLDWPYMTGDSEGGWDGDNAERLADDLADKLGIQTRVGAGYQSAKRTDVHWIFEPDGSLEPDDTEDLPVEIISPPMPLQEALAKMEQFFKWAKAKGAYANVSTGFHMGVSLPYSGGDVDYVKLALFLGDEHVLKEFGRQSNYYTKSALKLIRDRVQGNSEKIESAMDLMKHNLIELAHRSIAKSSTGKYESINMKGGYIEFRSAGGDDYFEDISKIQNTMMRYAQAMAIAGNPAAERQEYYKKLTKLLNPTKFTPSTKGERQKQLGNDPSLDLFAKFASGAITANELKSLWAEKTLKQEPKGDWKLWDSNGNPVPGMEFRGFTKSDAMSRAKKKLSPGSSVEDFQKAYKLLPIDGTPDSVEEPPRKLSNRELLAKRIKEPKPKETDKEKSGDDVERNWEYVRRDTGEIVGTSTMITLTLAKHLAQRYGIEYGTEVVQRSVPSAASAERARTRSGEPVPGSTVDIQQRRAQGEFTGEWKVVDPQGNEIYRFGGVGNVQADANNVAIGWLRSHPEHLQQGVQVLPVMNEAIAKSWEATLDEMIKPISKWL